MAGSAATAFLFVFLVGTVTLFYVSLLDDERLIAAVGLSTFVEPFVLAFGLAIASASTVLVSQSLGEGDSGLAAGRETSCIALTAAALCAAVGLLQAFRSEPHELFMRPGPVFDAADGYLEITLFSLPPPE